MKGWPALYLATDPTTAVAEYYQDIVQPGMLTPYRVDASRIADLTKSDGHAADDTITDALVQDWKTVARIDGRVPLSWTLAQELIAGGAEGALIPSVRNRGGRNLVLWRWHDARAAGEGAALTLLDPDAASGGRQA